MASPSRIRTLLFIAIAIIVLGIIITGYVLLRELHTGRQAAPIDQEGIKPTEVEVGILPADAAPSTATAGDQGG